MPRVVAFRPELVTLTGDHVSAVVLSQIMFWHAVDRNGNTRLRIRHDGKLWLVKSREDMLKETGITLAQYRRVIPRLVALGLIEYRLGWFAGRKTPFMRIVLFQHNQLCGGQHNQLSGLQHDHYIDVDRSTAETSTGADAPTAVQGGPMVKSKSSRAEGTAVEVVEQILARRKDVGSTVVIHWKKRMATLHGPNYRQLTVKDRAQLKRVHQLAGDRVYTLIDHVCANWLTFAQRAQALAGLSTYPAAPHIGFLLAHTHVGLQLIAKPSGKPVSPKTVSDPIVQSPVVVENQAPPVHSKEEVYAALAELEELAKAAKGSS